MTMPREPYESADSVADYVQQSRTFLSKGREYLAAGDLHQASEKGWGAAAWMAKAAAEAQGWKYSRHDEYLTVMYEAESLTGDDRLRALRATAQKLHGFFHTRNMFLRSETINHGLDDVGLLLDILQPLTGLEYSHSS